MRMPQEGMAGVQLLIVLNGIEMRYGHLPRILAALLIVLNGIEIIYICFNIIVFQAF